MSTNYHNLTDIFINSSMVNITVAKSKFITFFDLKVAYCSIGCLGMVLNLFVVVVLLKFANGQSSFSTGSSTFHICWQACVDAVVALLLLTTSLIEDNIISHYNPDNIFHEIVCRIWVSKVVLWAALTTSIFSVLALNFERYMAVVNPIFHKVKFSRTRKYSIVILACILGMSVVYKCSSALISCGISPKNKCRIFAYWPSVAYKNFVERFSVIFEYFIPLGLIIIFYLLMAYKLHHKIFPENFKKSIPVINALNTIDQSIRQDNHSMEKNEREACSKQEMIRARNNVLKTSVLLSAAFIICWSPNQVYYTMYQFGFMASLGSPFYHFSVLMVFLNCCFNPAIYCLKYKPFQKSFSNMVKKCKSILKD